MRLSPKDRRTLSPHVIFFVQRFLLLVMLSLALVAYISWSTEQSPLSHLLEHAAQGFGFSIPIVPSKPNTTLALLYPPGFLGGYRNQVIRLMGFVAYAVKHEYPYLHLPSILWRSQMQQYAGEPWYPIPMELIFDVDYWNLPQFSHALPRLVRDLQHSDCWTKHVDPLVQAKWDSLHPLQQASLQQGGLGPIVNITHAAIANASLFNPRRVDLLPLVSHCQHPVVYGGGKGAGTLWNDYLAYRNNKTGSSRMPKDVDHFILRALRPAQRWTALADECVAAKHGAEYLALHARVEMEMMAHNCGAEMNWNLTDIFKQVADFLTSNKDEDDIGGVFVAVSRDGMQANVSEGPWQRFKPYADDNLATLNRLVGNHGRDGEGLLDGKVTVFECGKHMMDHFYASHSNEIYYGSLLEQVINFHIAVSAKVFVGVKHSSYSTDVWTTRYYQGRGSANFQYTREGRMEPVENGGLPTPHGNCARKKRKAART